MKNFFEALDTPGAHTILLFVLLLVGIGMATKSMPKSEEVISISLGALVMGLRPRNGNSGTPAPK